MAHNWVHINKMMQVERFHQMWAGIQQHMQKTSEGGADFSQPGTEMG